MFSRQRYLSELGRPGELIAHPEGGRLVYLGMWCAQVVAMVEVGNDGMHLKACRDQTMQELKL